MSTEFNTLLQAEVTQLQKSLGVQIHLLDISSLFNSVMANPANYGLTNITGMAINSSFNGNGYLFWDQEHPTTAVDQIIGGLAAQSVPEPPSVFLFGSVFGALVYWHKSAMPTGLPASGVIDPSDESFPRVVRSIRVELGLATGDCLDRTSGYSDHGLAVGDVVTSGDDGVGAPTTESRPMLTGATRIEPAPMRLRSSILVGFFETPSKLAVTAVAPKFIDSPSSASPR